MIEVIRPATDCRLVGGLRGAFVELTADLAVQLGNGLAAAQRLNFVEGAGLRVPDREQADVARPEKGEGLGQGGRIGGLSRCCLEI